MEALNLSYDICRLYLKDYESNIPNCDQILGLVRSRSFERLSQVSSIFDPAKHGANELRHLRQIEAFFKKNASFRGEAAQAAALQSFLAAEEVCRQTNLRLDVVGLQPHHFGRKLNVYIQRMERFIADVLGDFDSFVPSIPGRIKLTAGATAGRGRKDAWPIYKMTSRNLQATPGAQRYLWALGEASGLTQMSLRTTVANRVTFVAKSWKTDRTIACEPDGNIPLQLAFDGYCKERLRRYGVDLSDQENNKELARQGSFNGEREEYPNYSTIDLSAASDTIAYNLVVLLFPWEWQRYLNDVRCSRYLLPGATEPSVYHKFSSMGNGTTFPVETLIFTAACHAVGSRNHSVYGDDIIIEQKFFDDVVNLLSFLGFTTNKEKSFSTGFFRESCGGDFYRGIDVTPFYLRKEDLRKANLSHLVNGLAKIGLPYGELWKYAIKLCRKYQLGIVPYTGHSTAGVEVEPSLAWRLPSTRMHASLHSPQFKAYCLQTKVRGVYDIRAYALRYFSSIGNSEVALKRLNVSALALSGLPDDQVLISDQLRFTSMPTGRTKFVRKWVRWFHPPEGVPVHIYLWSECLELEFDL